MLDNLYDDIGGKIKGLAKGTFIIEAIGVIIAGLILIFTDEYLVLWGFLALICGPIVAWVSSWILYAFGELVEKTSENERNTKAIFELLKEIHNEKNNNQLKQKTTNNTFYRESNMDSSSKKAQYTTNENGTIICSLCNYEQPSNRKVCWHCGAKFEETAKNTVSHQWLCDGCKKMRTQTPCEHCGKE